MTDTWKWATVTQPSPLRIKVEGDTSELDATTDNLVGALAVDDRVRVHLHSDGIIVTGIQGGAGDGQLPERLQETPTLKYGADFNTLTDTGWYKNANGTNAPIAYTWFYVEVISHDTSDNLQVATHLFSDKRFYRRQHSDVWQPWVEIAAYESGGQLKAADGVADDDVATVGQLIPIGGGITWWGTSDPASPGGGIAYAIPDGRALSRTTYATLFALWGTTFGTGNGTSTFNMPDATGRVQVGRDSADTDFNAMGETRGAKTHTLTVAEMPSHNHSLTRTSSAGTGSTRIPTGPAPTSETTSVDVNDTGGDDAHNNLQPSIVANTAIRIN